jgi:ribonuclease Z
MGHAHGRETFVIDVVLLGTGAMVPLPGRWLSSALIRVNGSLILFDCGEGTQIAMREVHWGFRRLDAICLSHLHADHVAGLPGLFHTVTNAGRTEPMHIFGPPGTRRVVDGLRVIASHLPYEVAVTELVDDETFGLPGGLAGSVREGSHRVPCLGYRLSAARQPAFRRDRAVALGVPRELWSRLQSGETIIVDGRPVRPADVLGEARPGIALGLVTDTRPTEALAELVRGVDLLICEATYGEDDERPKAELHGHMTLREAATLAGQANVKNLWLTHFGAGMMDPMSYRSFAQELFPPAEIGESGLTASLTFRRGYERIARGDAVQLAPAEP